MEYPRSDALAVAAVEAELARFADIVPEMRRQVALDLDALPVEGKPVRELEEWEQAFDADTRAIMKTGLLPVPLPVGIVDEEQRGRLVEWARLSAGPQVSPRRPRAACVPGAPPYPPSPGLAQP